MHVAFFSQRFFSIEVVGLFTWGSISFFELRVKALIYFILVCDLTNN